MKIAAVRARRRLDAMRSACGPFRRARAGIAAVEFSLLLPVMLVLAVLSTQIGTMIVIQKKLRTIASTVSQITSQYQTVAGKDMSMILGAANAIIGPYASPPLAVVVSLIVADATGSGTIVWSSSSQGPARLTGSRVSLPAGMGTNGSYFVMGESSYQFTPMIGSALVKQLNLSDRVYAAPRSGTVILRTP